MRVVFFEDRSALHFGPIAQLRPNFELICGHHSLRERVVRTGRIRHWGGFVREPLVDVYREQNPEAHINETPWLRDEPTLFLNGGWVASQQSVAAIDPRAVGL